MTIAASVQDLLDRERVPYTTIAHQLTQDSCHSAQAAHVSGDRLAKGVMLVDDQGYLLAIIPASHRVDLGALHRELKRDLGLATDRELYELFKDCEPGALPPLGAAYGIDSILDDSLVDRPDVYFEGGDHQALVHVDGSDFMKLMANVPRAHISHHM